MSWSWLKVNEQRESSSTDPDGDSFTGTVLATNDR